MNLRPKQKQPFSGFTDTEVEKMEQLFEECKDQPLDVKFCKKLARSFNYSNNRAGKPILKCTEVHSWFEEKRRNSFSNESSFDSKKDIPILPEDITHDKATQNLEVPKEAERLFPMSLRRQKQPFSGFTNAEVEKMEQLFDESKDQSLDVKFCKRLARSFSCSSNRAGKPILKWTQVQRWFEKKPKNSFSNESPFDSNKNIPILPEEEDIAPDEATKNLEFPKDNPGRDMSKMKFEARSSSDGAWYDVDAFLSHRSVNPDEIEVCVRYAGFGEEDDEWVNVKRDVRERSIALEHFECSKLNIGDLVMCFQEKEEEARYYDAHIRSIQRKLHDLRGCRCLFLIRYVHDQSEERGVPLRRLYCQPNFLARSKTT